MTMTRTTTLKPFNRRIYGIINHEEDLLSRLEHARKVTKNPHMTLYEYAIKCQEDTRKTSIWLQDLRSKSDIENEIMELVLKMQHEEAAQTKENNALGPYGEKDEEEKEKKKVIMQECVQTCDWIKNRLGEKVANVLISNKHISSSSPPCVLVSKRVLEINPDHPIIMNLNAACKTNPNDGEALRAIDLVYDVALLSSGFAPENPAKLGGKLYEMMSTALCGKWSK